MYKGLARAGLITTFSEYTTLAAATFFTFSFVTGGQFGTTTVRLLGGMLDTLLDPTNYPDLGTGFTTLFLCLLPLWLVAGYALSVFHPFSNRPVSSLEARVMMVFGACFTVWAAAMTAVPAFSAPSYSLYGLPVQATLAYILLVSAFLTFTVVTRTDDAHELWNSHQPSLRMSLSIIGVVLATGIYGLLSGWPEHEVYQYALLIVFIMGVVSRRLSPQTET